LQAAATIDPTSRPTTTEQLFRIGGPKRSHKMMVAKTKKPSPMNSGLPHSNAWGASALGHMARGEGPQEEPPPQSCMADLISEAPISRTVGPVTRGGKTRARILLLMNERPISSSEHRHDVPSRAPYP